MPKKLPETYKNWGKTSKYPDYTDTKVFGYVAVVLWLKKLFSLPTGHVFFRRLYMYLAYLHQTRNRCLPMILD
jgi:hypothetical protein